MDENPVVARRLTSKDEKRLLRLKGLLEANAQQRQELIDARDDLVCELIEDGARIVDLADVLELNRRAVERARDRSRARNDS